MPSLELLKILWATYRKMVMNLMKLVAAGVLAISATATHAATIFMPTDGDVNFLDSTLSQDTLLAMFDDSDLSYLDPLLIGVPEIVIIGGPTTGGDWIATNELADTLTLTGSDHFILGISTDGGTSWSGDTSVTPLGANSYTVSFSDGSVLEVDVAIVPVPAAVWLFGSGLLGLVGVARRRA